MCAFERIYCVMRFAGRAVRSGVSGSIVVVGDVKKLHVLYAGGDVVNDGTWVVFG